MTSKDGSCRGRPKPRFDFRVDRPRKAKIACFSFFAGNQERNQFRWFNRSPLVRYSQSKIFDPSDLDMDCPRNTYKRYLVDKLHAI